MKDIYLKTENLPRELSVCPKVYSIAYFNNHVLMPQQVVHGTQICLRFHSSIKEIDFTVNEKNYSAGFPHLLIKRDQERHQINTPGKSDCFYFTYSAENSPIVPETLIVSEFNHGIEIDRRIHEIIQLVTDSCDYGVFDRIDGMCQQLLIELLLKCDTNTIVDENEMNIRKIFSYIQIHFNEDISFDEIARHFGFSIRSFYRHWSNYHPMSPHDLIVDLKIEESKRLLTETTLSVEDISEAMNYGCSAYFVSFFKKHTQVTPHQYRKQINGLK